MKALEYILAVLFAMVLCLLLFFYYKNVKPYAHGDTGFLIEGISNISTHKEASSHILAQNGAEIELARVNLEEYCQMGLVAGQFVRNPSPIFSLHAYVFMYLVAFGAMFAGALNAISFFTAFSFSVIPVISYFFLRKSGVSIIISILSTAVIVIHPAYLISSNGQFYMDRLFIPFAFVYLLLLDQYLNSPKPDAYYKKFFPILLILIGIIGGLTSERNMLIIAICSFIYPIAATSTRNKKNIILIFSVSCLLYIFLYVHFWEGTRDNTQIQKTLFNIRNIVGALNRTGIGEYFLFNFPLLLLPAVISPKLFFVALPVVAINCVVTVGGAEKNGWLTHYHSHYYGIIAASSLIAIVTLYNKLKSSHMPLYQSKLVSGLIVIIIIFQVSINRLYPAQNICFSLYDYYIRPQQLSISRTQKDIFDRIANNVPKNATITATEWGIAAWYLRGNKTDIFPIGVGLNEYIMIQADESNSTFRILSAVRYRRDTAEANECFVDYILNNYKIIAREATWVLFKKTQPHKGKKY